MKGVWRKVERYTRWNVPWEWCFGHRGASTVTLHLECGHTKTQKGSVTIPKRARCCECPAKEKECSGS